MNIDTGEIRQFGSAIDLAEFVAHLSTKDREVWVEIDPAKMTGKQLKRMIVESHDHRSRLAVERDIIRKQRRSARRKESKT